MKNNTNYQILTKDEMDILVKNCIQFIFDYLETQNQKQQTADFLQTYLTNNLEVKSMNLYVVRHGKP